MESRLMRRIVRISQPYLAEPPYGHHAHTLHMRILCHFSVCGYILACTGLENELRTSPALLYRYYIREKERYYMIAHWPHPTL